MDTLCVYNKHFICFSASRHCSLMGLCKWIWEKSCRILTYTNTSLFSLDLSLIVSQFSNCLALSLASLFFQSIITLLYLFSFFSLSLSFSFNNFFSLTLSVSLSFSLSHCLTLIVSLLLSLSLSQFSDCLPLSLSFFSPFLLFCLCLSLFTSFNYFLSHTHSLTLSLSHICFLLLSLFFLLILVHSVSSPPLSLSHSLSSFLSYSLFLTLSLSHFLSFSYILIMFLLPLSLFIPTNTNSNEYREKVILFQYNKHDLIHNQRPWINYSLKERKKLFWIYYWGCGKGTKYRTFCFPLRSEMFFKFKFKFSLKLTFLKSVSQILINEARWLYLSWFWPLLKRESFFEAAGAVAKIGLSLEPNHYLQI